MRLRIAVCLLSSMVLMNVGLAQDEPKPLQQKFYRLDFVVKELENDKVINSRLHSMSVGVNSGNAASIRAGSKVPYMTGSPGSRQFNFFDIGVNIDCRETREAAPGQLTLTINADISSVVIGKESTGELPPMVRSTRWSSPVLVPIRKATTVFSSDDPSGNRKMQLELTAVPIG
jgi:hypothetical protein